MMGLSVIDLPINELPAAQNIEPTDLFVLQQGENAKSLPGHVIQAWFNALAQDVTQTATAAKAAAQAAQANAQTAEAAAELARQQAAGYATAAQGFANEAAAAAGAVTVSIGWDADGYFSIFEKEE